MNKRIAMGGIGGNKRIGGIMGPLVDGTLKWGKSARKGRERNADALSPGVAYLHPPPSSFYVQLIGPIYVFQLLFPPPSKTPYRAVLHLPLYLPLPLLPFSP
jgi:hypothetical protein